MTNISLNDVSSTTSNYTVAYLAAGMFGVGLLFSNPLLPSHATELQKNALVARPVIDSFTSNSGESVINQPDNDISNYNELKKFVNEFVKNIQDIPPEFNKIFREKMWDLLA